MGASKLFFTGKHLETRENVYLKTLEDMPGKVRELREVVFFRIRSYKDPRDMPKALRSNSRVFRIIVAEILLSEVYEKDIGYTLRKLAKDVLINERMKVSKRMEED